MDKSKIDVLDFKKVHTEANPFHKNLFKFNSGNAIKRKSSCSGQLEPVNTKNLKVPKRIKENVSYKPSSDKSLPKYKPSVNRVILDNSLFDNTFGDIDSLNMSPMRRFDSPLMGRGLTKNSLMDSVITSSNEERFNYNLSDSSNSIEHVEENLSFISGDLSNKDEWNNLYIPTFVLKKEEYDILKLPEIRAYFYSADGYLDSGTGSKFEIEEKRDVESRLSMKYSTILLLNG